LKVEILHFHKPKDIFKPVYLHYQKQLTNFASSNKTNALPEKAPQHILVGLDTEGKIYSSEDFAQYIGNLMPMYKKIIFLIGDVEGFKDEQKKDFDHLISLSKMTLTADFALILLWEQIYRSHCILSGRRYHR
jgi:rRNA large subunit m3Psi methyltransferase RlmH